MKRENKDAVLASYQDCVRKYGQPRRLLADNAGVYRGNRFTQYICDLWISLWQYKDKKQTLPSANNRLSSDSPTELWNALALSPSFGFSVLHLFARVWIIQLTLPLSVPDLLWCSQLVNSKWYQSLPIVSIQWSRLFPWLWQARIPSESRELRGRWMGISEDDWMLKIPSVISSTTNLKTPSCTAPKYVDPISFFCTDSLWGASNAVCITWCEERWGEAKPISNFWYFWDVYDPSSWQKWRAEIGWRMSVATSPSTSPKWCAGTHNPH